MKSSVPESPSFPIDKENASMMEKILSWFAKLEKWSARSELLADFVQIHFGVSKGLVCEESSDCEAEELKFDNNCIDFGLCKSPRITFLVLTACFGFECWSF